MNNVKDNYWNIFLMLVIVLLFGYAGASDFKELEAAQSEYCTNVKSGQVPDFNKTYDEECK